MSFKKLVLALSLSVSSVAAAVSVPDSAIVIRGVIQDPRLTAALAITAEAALLKEKKVMSLFINSPGGSSMIAVDSITVLQDFKNRGGFLSCYVTGMIASAAFDIMTQCSEVYAEAGTLLMFHRGAINTDQTSFNTEDLTAMLSMLSLLDQQQLVWIESFLVLSKEDLFRAFYGQKFWGAAELKKVVKKVPFVITNLENVPVALKLITL